MNQEDNEINLIDYIRVIIKRKNLILVFLLAGLIITGVLTFLLPETYNVATYLEIGSYSNELGEQVLIKHPKTIIGKINNGFYENSPKLKAWTEGSLIKIERISKNQEEAKKTLENINNLVLKEHNQIIETKKENFEKSLKELQEKIKILTNRNKETAVLGVKAFNVQRQINTLQPTEIIKEPTIVSEKKPNLPFNLICGGLLGIFLGLFFAFGKEWREENKKRL
ncbi:hypothetical protein KJA13_00760 [Patescibacteria group bacterium]|nr:hypothetical protein [Patescibacteria group bacterium]